MSKEVVRKYYAAFDEQEWHRLTWPEGLIEFAITTHTLQCHLPPTGKILDIGGGPGRYTIWMAQQGYRVVLADISANLLDVARTKIDEAGVQNSVDEITICDACNLSQFGNETFDAVVCLGPFYHLPDPTDRARAAAELVRVLKPDGCAFIALMPVYTFLRRTLALSDEQHHFAQPNFMEQLMENGIFLNDVEQRFSAGYGIYPQEVAPFFGQYGLTMIDLLADTGFAAPYAQQLARLADTQPEAYRVAMNIIIRTANDPSILGAGIHLLYVGKKSGTAIDSGLL